MEGRQGPVEITDGKVDGDEMKLTIDVNGNEMEMTAKRIA